ncbi:MAG: serine hydroxymethyltransferase [Coprobacillus sp.]|nr:serine hydroxymethyltransferase [Coprobacillus sp.]
MADEVFDIIDKEYERQATHIELIASENFVSPEVLKAQGSILTNKYAEGYPGKRYYGGCENVDEIEKLAISRVCELFGCKYANVQPHSGSQANEAVYRALLNRGDVILGMSLDAGGHLTHGYYLSFSGQDYEAYNYGLNSESELIDYDALRELALEKKPKLIVCGASAYPRIIDFKKFREICDEVGAYLFVDMAHIAGLVAAGEHPSPFPYADVVTSTTHKTLRGPRGGIILTNSEELIKKINKSVFPGTQGGPLEHVIAAKAVCFGEDLKPEFKQYQHQVVLNASALAKTMMELGYHVISNGTDNHLLLVDIYHKTGLTGKQAEDLLGTVNITVNKNAICNDELPPAKTSGIRLGSPAMTTRGFKEEDFIKVGHLIDETLTGSRPLEDIKSDVLSLTKAHPLPYE